MACGHLDARVKAGVNRDHDRVFDSPPNDRGSMTSHQDHRVGPQTIGEVAALLKVEDKHISIPELQSDIPDRDSCAHTGSRVYQWPQAHRAIDGIRQNFRGMIMDDRLYVRTRRVDRTMYRALPVEGASLWIDRITVEVKLKNVIFSDELRTA